MPQLEKLRNWCVPCLLATALGCGGPTRAAHQDEDFDGTRLDGTRDPAEALSDPVEQQFASAEGATPVSVPASLGGITSLAVGLWHNSALDVGGEVGAVQPLASHDRPQRQQRRRHEGGQQEPGREAHRAPEVARGTAVLRLGGNRHFVNDAQDDGVERVAVAA